MGIWAEIRTGNLFHKKDQLDIDAEEIIRKAAEQGGVKLDDRLKLELRNQIARTAREALPQVEKGHDHMLAEKRVEIRHSLGNFLKQERERTGAKKGDTLTHSTLKKNRFMTGGSVQAGNARYRSSFSNLISNVKKKMKEFTPDGQKKQEGIAREIEKERPKRIAQASQRKKAKDRLQDERSIEQNVGLMPTGPIYSTTQAAKNTAPNTSRSSSNSPFRKPAQQNTRSRASQVVATTLTKNHSFSSSSSLSASHSPDSRSSSPKGQGKG